MLLTLLVMTAVRKRTGSSTSLSKGDDLSLDERSEKTREMSFSDDDESFSPKITAASSRINAARELDPTMGDFPGFPTQAGDDEELNHDIDIFNKAVNISNIDEVDHASLLVKMHSRFKKKVDKWERLAYTYSRYTFLMNFTILIIQIFQMILQQAASIWMDEKHLMPKQPEKSKSFLQNLKLREWRSSGQADSGQGQFFTYVLTPQFLQTVYSLLTATTALIAGLQLKLKMNDKAERYKRGAKIYGRLLRISSYYIMMVESGGKIDDVSGLWREAMKMEGKSIPVIRSYMPM